MDPLAPIIIIKYWTPSRDEQLKIAYYSLLSAEIARQVKMEAASSNHFEFWP